MIYNYGQCLSSLKLNVKGFLALNQVLNNKTHLYKVKMDRTHVPKNINSLTPFKANIKQESVFLQWSQHHHIYHQ
jgi:hypothetical protein